MLLFVVADPDLTFGRNCFRRWLMSQPQADRFAADGKSGYRTRSNRTGSAINSKALITSTAARIVGSETGSTVMTNDLPARVAHQFGCHELQSGQVEA
jgi:hypothetical protein